MHRTWCLQVGRYALNQVSIDNDSIDLADSSDLVKLLWSERVDISLLDLVCQISCNQLQDGLAVGSQTKQQIIACGSRYPASNSKAWYRELKMK